MSNLTLLLDPPPVFLFAGSFFPLTTTIISEKIPFVKIFGRKFLTLAKNYDIIFIESLRKAFYKEKGERKMAKSKNAIIVPKGLKSKQLDAAARWLRSVDVYEFEEEELLWEAEELKEHYDNVVIVLKTNK